MQTSTRRRYAIGWGRIIAGRTARALVFLALAGMLCGTVRAQKTLGDFWVPKYDQKGRMIWQIFGTSAIVLAKGDIDVTNLRLELFRDGRQDAIITAPQCTVNQTTGMASSDASVRIERNDMVVTGIGFDWNSKDGLIRIHDKVRIVFADQSGAGKVEETE